jgi:uncharacterized membrane protein YeaQ/YmgE (transglycosylase-associated protein family)
MLYLIWVLLVAFFKTWEAIIWIIYGLFVGTLARWLHPGEDEGGWFATLSIGVIGSFIGGLIGFILGFGVSLLEPSGIVMGTIGGIIFCWIYRKYRLAHFFRTHGRMPLMKPFKKD